MEPIILTEEHAKEFIQHIDQICKKYNREYLEKYYKNLLESDAKIYQGERHDSLISIANSLLFRCGDAVAATDDNNCIDPQLEQELKNRFSILMIKGAYHHYQQMR